MSRHDETTPVLKVRHLKRLQEEKRISLPLPPGCRYTTTEPMELSGSEESDLEIEITFDKDHKFTKYIGDNFSDFDNDYTYELFKKELGGSQYITGDATDKCEDATVLKKTFALTAQRRKGTIVLLDVQAKIRKIPATIISDDEEHVEITTDPRYLPGVEDSMGFVIEPKEEPCDIEEELEEEVNDDEPVLELEEISDEDGDSEKENIATNQQTNQQTLIINLTISDDVHEDDMQSDTTELNPDVPSTVPLTNPTNDVAQTPQRPTK
ncbi:hypothetical protein DAPPUDRAFT_270610 [Daphnia pulex]|uniref:Uncharacterized protein n=1 Tax=Daphnia pulex TaxID=6669 RepID=E9I104_DAPPU|nr:hypothetical protein DAPPUDRAFT_270610 [Daphnia pulex]|eukprot:EFX62326.1 hypothetical protein DAPPUDRAFT_270610 [Daphnia pulex]